MKAEFKSVKSDDIEMEMTISMPLGRWKQLREQAKGTYPASDLRQSIYEMIRFAEKQFYPEMEE